MIIEEHDNVMGKLGCIIDIHSGELFLSESTYYIRTSLLADTKNKINCIRISDGMMIPFNFEHVVAKPDNAKVVIE